MSMLRFVFVSCGIVAWPGPDPWSIGRQESARSQGFVGVFERILVVLVGSGPTLEVEKKHGKNVKNLNC